MFHDCGIKTYAAVVDKDAISVESINFSEGAAAVIGNEGRGLTREDADLCDDRITIKMQGNIDSLNAAMAARNHSLGNEKKILSCLFSKQHVLLNLSSISYMNLIRRSCKAL